jgi:hypothetical protein
VRIAEPARRHGVADADIWHAVRNAMRQVESEDEFTLLIGPARDGAPLEIGIVGIEGDDPAIIHAMPLRPKFHAFLG